PVVIHDDSVDRTTRGSGTVGSLSLEELRALDAGQGERIPTLAEVCELVKEAAAGLVVEIKEVGSEEAACRVLEEHRIADPIVVSFHEESIKAVNTLLPRALTGHIFSRAAPDPSGTARSLGATFILPKYTLLAGRMVRDAHRIGVLVVPWTLNVPEAWERAMSLGVDGFATDDPCAARKYSSGQEETGSG
ncbi:MAG: glycerophosphodiester phosphodiesterase family protein, partial [Methanomicrobiaceae archaeon]|nr:glycerophosphodiester phosphodiesterase family protein [Methanomicrobiaceae archaeon]